MQTRPSNVSASSADNNPGGDPSSWVDLHGDALFRFALIRVQNQDQAEDLVQETFLSALKAVDKFQGRSTVRTWLTGILKRKIIDQYRKTVKEIPASDLDVWEEDDKNFFDERGHWKSSLQDWKDSPEDLIESKEFWWTFHACLSKLPENHRRVFTLREIDGIEGGEVCEILSISQSNLFVMIHRARAKLRKCLDANWFLNSPKEGQ